MDHEIITRTEQVGAKLAPTSTAEAEPRLTITELHSLLRAAADLERASRPIYMQPAAQPVPVPHPGADIRVPSRAAPAAFTTVAPQPDKRSPWGLLFMVSGCTGLGACATTAVTGSQYSLLAFFACVALWGTSAYQLVILRKG